MPISLCRRVESHKLKAKRHDYVTTYDGEGREMRSCRKCGNITIEIIKKKK